MKYFLPSLVSIKKSSVYYDGKRVNHDVLASLCKSAYYDLSVAYGIMADRDKTYLRHGLLWSELPYHALLAVLSRLILDWCSLFSDVDRHTFESEFSQYAKFPSFLKENKKKSVSIEFSVLYFVDKTPAGYLYKNGFFSSFSLLENYIHDIYPSDKFDVEFISC